MGGVHLPGNCCDMSYFWALVAAPITVALVVTVIVWSVAVALRNAVMLLLRALWNYATGKTALPWPNP